MLATGTAGPGGEGASAPPPDDAARPTPSAGEARSLSHLAYLTEGTLFRLLASAPPPVTMFEPGVIGACRHREA